MEVKAIPLEKADRGSLRRVLNEDQHLKPQEQT